MDGFGLSIGLARQCTADEKALTDKRRGRQCVFVGSIKKNNHLGINFSKEYVYCCFPTKLSRVFQEYGRRQLGISWGSPANPNCRGLTIHELQRIDMSKIDFREVFADMAASMSKATEQLKISMESKQKDFSKNSAQDVQKKKQEELIPSSNQQNSQSREGGLREAPAY